MKFLWANPSKFEKLPLKAKPIVWNRIVLGWNCFQPKLTP